MTDITPTSELVKQWQEAWYRSKVKPAEYELYIAACAAQWGSDQELEACCDWMSECTVGCPNELRAVRRPKPPSFKKQALRAAHIEVDPQGRNGSLIIRALEALPDD